MRMSDWSSDVCSADLHRHRVLLIEDDPPIRERLAGALAAHGDCIVAEAANLAEARTLLAQQPPDLIVADLGLPDGLAIDFLAEARERQPEIEILVISVLGDDTPLLQAIAGIGRAPCVERGCQGVWTPV